MDKRRREVGNVKGFPTPEEWTAIGKIVSAPVVALMSQNDKGLPETIGTGFLVRDRSAYYVITAAHVLHETTGSGRILFFFSPGAKEPVQLATESYRATSAVQDRDNDVLDVGVVRLSRPPAIEPLSITLLAPDRLPRDYWRYIAVGYPLSKTKVNPRSQSKTFACLITAGRGAPDAAYKTLRLDPATAILTEHDEDLARDEHGSPAGLSDPVGMSGGPLWIREPHNPNDPERTAYTEKVVGVMTTYYPGENVICSVDVKVILQLMSDF
jgi:hypothetical protein